MKKELLTGCAVLFYFCGPGQTFHKLAPFGYNSTGAYSLQFTDAFSTVSNPASLGSIQHFSCGVLAENKWMLEGLNNYSFASSFPIGGDGFGIVLQQNGNDEFKEQDLELAYGKNLGKLDLGIAFNYLRDQTEGYGSTQFISSGLGLRYRISKKLMTGWDLGIAVSGKAGKTNPERAPQWFRMGFGYSMDKDLFLSLQIEKQSGLPGDFCGYIEYRYLDHLIFGAGIHSDSGSLFFKTGWRKNHLCIQFCFAYEPVLGLSPGIVLLWETKIKTE